MIRIKLTVKENVTSETKRIRRRLSDMRPLFRSIRDEWVKQAFANVFRTNGRGTWPPTQRPNPILRDTRALLRSYTQEYHTLIYMKWAWAT